MARAVNAGRGKAGEMAGELAKVVEAKAEVLAVPFLERQLS